MNLTKAKELQSKYSDPKDYKETLKQLRKFATLGFSNASFVYSKESKAQEIGKKLEKLGYQVYCGPWSSGFILETQW